MIFDNGLLHRDRQNIRMKSSSEALSSAKYTLAMLTVQTRSEYHNTWSDSSLLFKTLIILELTWYMWWNIEIEMNRKKVRVESHIKTRIWRDLWNDYRFMVIYQIYQNITKIGNHDLDLLKHRKQNQTVFEIVLDVILYNR